MANTDLEQLVARALAEDVGTADVGTADVGTADVGTADVGTADLGGGDVTTQSTVPAGARGRAAITQKQDGVLAGLATLREVVRQAAPDVTLTLHVSDGDRNPAGTLVAELEGDVAQILLAERTALNFLQRLSGIATLTARYVAAVSGTQARILDTRKTTPTLRALEKAAVAAGGGVNHRFGLFDMVLIKENHIAAAGGVAAAIEAARAKYPDLPMDVECRTRAEADEALAARAPRLLLDNMSTDELRSIVANVGGRAEVEASGGVTLESVRLIAETGVDFISVGALTHSAPALDLALILEKV